MISYCIASFRAKYSRMLIEDLLRKTTAPFEILVWLNLDDPDFEGFIEMQRLMGAPLRIAGKTPENIGMRAYLLMFEQARHELIVQIDDDVIAVSRNIAEQAYEIFNRFPRVRQLVADVWQDDYTTGARPSMNAYRSYQADYGLYDGPIDGWFSIFHRSALHLVNQISGSAYLPLGAMLKNRLKASGQLGLLCTKFKVFHVIGPQYASYFGMLDFEIEKYRRLGRSDLVNWYETAKETLPRTDELETRVNGILADLDHPVIDKSHKVVMNYLEDQAVVSRLKDSFAPDGGAEREHNARPDSSGFGLIHYSLVTNLRPERALVIGSRYGYIPGIIALALKANGSGTVDFVDANYSDNAHGFTLAFGGVENWHGDPLEKFASCGLEAVINVYVMRSSDFFAQCNSQYGYIYLDGDHSYEGCKYDFEESLKVASPGALLTLHDAVVKQSGFGVNRLFEELESDMYERILIPAWPGLGIIQLRQKGHY